MNWLVPVRTLLALGISLFTLTATPMYGQCAIDSMVPLRFALPRVQAAAVDHLGNFYFVTPQQGLEKYSADGRLQKRYADNRLGRITAIDVSNPLKVLAWYGDFRTAVFLDRSLTLLGQLDLLAGAFGEVRTVALARDGNLWIYDEAAFKLRKITPEGAELYASQELNLLYDQPVRLTGLVETDQQLLAFLHNGAILRFDLYAQFRQADPPRPGLQPIGVRDERLYLRRREAPALVIQQFADGQERICTSAALSVDDTNWLWEPGLLLYVGGGDVQAYVF